MYVYPSGRNNGGRTYLEEGWRTKRRPEFYFKNFLLQYFRTQTCMGMLKLQLQKIPLSFENFGQIQHFNLKVNFQFPQNHSFYEKIFQTL